jgi:hypothetical protein
MEDDILQVIEEEITDNPTLEEMKVALLNKGFQEQHINETLKKYAPRFGKSASGIDKTKKEIRLFSTKEVLDRIGYGFVSHQFINILFYQTALIAGVGHLAYFLVGLFNGLKSLFSTIISSFLQEYSKVNQISKNVISRVGIIFGFSFLVMAISYRLGLWWLFALTLIIGSIGVVSYGDLYNQLLRSNLKKERMSSFLKHIGQFGIIITAFSLLASGWLLQTFPAEGKVVSLFGYSFTVMGFILSFMITTISFILSGYIISFIKQEKTNLTYPLGQFISEYRARIKSQRKLFFKNKFTFLLLITAILLGVVQALGNSFFGIFIYTEFNDVLLGGFLNVAVIYTVAVLVSVLGPWVTTKVNKSIGYTPMLVFGTMLIAMMPFFAAWQPNIYALGLANALSVIGAAIVGVAQGLLARKLLKEEERKLYFANLSFMITIPFIILLPLGAWIAQTYGLIILFKILVCILIGLVVPLYFILVALAEKRKL